MTDDLPARVAEAKRVMRELKFVIRDMLAAGSSAKDVADTFDMSPAYVSKLIRQSGVGPRQLARAKFDQIAEDYAKGDAIEVIMLRHNVGRRSVWNAVKRAGVPLRRGNYRDRSA